MKINLSIRSFLIATTSLMSAIALLQHKGFISIEGADMSARLKSAVKKATDASPQNRFWAAYAFTLRPELTIDPVKGEDVGGMSDAAVYIGRASNSPGGTRNVGVFILYDPGGEAIVRVEIYNLDRRGAYAGLPVYWLGHVTAKESLGYLRGVINSNSGRKVAGNATLALAMHDDPSVSGILKEQVHRSKDSWVRKTAIHWLGFIGGEDDFLESLVTSDKETTAFRAAAAYALGESASIPLSIMTGLYRTALPIEVRRALLYSIANNADRNGVFEFLRKVASNDPDSEARRQARGWLSETPDGKR